MSRFTNIDLQRAFEKARYNLQPNFDLSIAGAGSILKKSGPDGLKEHLKVVIAIYRYDEKDPRDLQMFLQDQNPGRRSTKKKEDAPKPAAKKAAKKAAKRVAKKASK